MQTICSLHDTTTIGHGREINIENTDEYSIALRCNCTACIWTHAPRPPSISITTCELTGLASETERNVMFRQYMYSDVLMCFLSKALINQNQAYKRPFIILIDKRPTPKGSSHARLSILKSATIHDLISSTTVKNKRH